MEKMLEDLRQLKKEYLECIEKRKSDPSGSICYSDAWIKVDDKRREIERGLWRLFEGL